MRPAAGAVARAATRRNHALVASRVVMLALTASGQIPPVWGDLSADTLPLARSGARGVIQSAEVAIPVSTRRLEESYAVVVVGGGSAALGLRSGRLRPARRSA